MRPLPTREDHNARLSALTELAEAIEHPMMAQITARMSSPSTKQLMSIFRGLGPVLRLFAKVLDDYYIGWEEAATARQTMDPE